MMNGGTKKSPLFLEMIDRKKIEQLIAEYLHDTDKFLVDLRISPANKIEVFIDGMNGVSVKDCVGLSRKIEGSLDREEEDFALDVSSPGADEPFKVAQQYEKNKGRKVNIVDDKGTEYTGVLCGVENNEVIIETTSKQKVENKKVVVTEKINLDLDKVKQTRVILSFK
jgi:ribosome maturation factor RimP